MVCWVVVRALGLVGIGCSGDDGLDDGLGVVFWRFLGLELGADGRLTPC